MSDWKLITRSSQDRTKQITGNDILRGGIFQGLIETSSGENQNARLSYIGGNDSMSLPMPFESADSWIRSIPTSGAAALVAYRRDTNKPTFIRYLNDTADKKLAMYQAGKNMYKPLLAGEHEIHSSGFAQTYYSQRPILEQRAGVIRSWLDQDRAEAGQKSPIHTRQFHTHKLNKMGDEERFGVVRRPKKLNPVNALILGASYSSNFYTYPYPDFSMPGGIPAAFSVVSQGIAETTAATASLTGTFKIRPFAKEYLRIINNPLDPLPPPVLLDVREGQVFDDDGKQVVGESGAYLRSKREYYTISLDSTKNEIDELGNVYWNLSMAATNGWSTRVPYGAWKLSANLGIDMTTLTSITMSSTLNTSISALTDLALESKLNTNITTGLNFSHTTNGTHDVSSLLGMRLKSNMNFTAEADLIFEAKGGVQMNLTAPLVAVGDKPSEPMVMGVKLSTWLTTLCELFSSNAATFGMGNLSAPVPINPTFMAGINSLKQQISALTSKTITLSP